jgi:hypothetical protein
MGKFVLSLLALAFTLPANAQVLANSALDGNQVLTACTSAKTHDYCIGYVTGVVDGIFYAEGTKQHICPEPGVLTQQVRDVVINYLKAHPEHRHAGAAGLVFNALYEKFPCR